MSYDVVVRDLGNKTIAEIKEIFERINSTKYSLNAMEINNSRYSGQFKQFADELSQHKFFDDHKFFSAGEIRRMNDVQFCATLVVTLLTTYFARNEEIEKFLQRYNDQFEQSTPLMQELEQVFKFIDDCNFDDKSRVWHHSDLFSLVVEVHRAISKKKKTLDVTKIAQRLKKFYQLVDDGDKSEILAQYALLSRKAINDRSNRIQRGQIVSDVLEGILP